MVNTAVRCATSQRAAKHDRTVAVMCAFMLTSASMNTPSFRTVAAGWTKVEHIRTAVVGIWCCHRTEEHHRTFVLGGFRWSRSALIHDQGRIQELSKAGAGWRAREREPITGVWGRSPQRGPGAEPLVRGSGGRSPLKLKTSSFLTPKENQHFATFQGFLGSFLCDPVEVTDPFSIIYPWHRGEWGDNSPPKRLNQCH